MWRETVIRIGIATGTETEVTEIEEIGNEVEVEVGVEVYQIGIAREIGIEGTDPEAEIGEKDQDHVVKKRRETGKEVHHQGKETKIPEEGRHLFTGMYLLLDLNTLHLCRFIYLFMFFFLNSQISFIYVLLFFSLV